MRFLFLLLISLLFVQSCKKKENLLHGNIKITGVVTDTYTKQGLPNMVVNLIAVRQIYNLIGYSDVLGDVKYTDTTDEFGNYSFDIDVQNQYAYALGVNSLSPYYIFTDNSLSKKYMVTKSGSHVKDISMKRTAFAKIDIRNTGYRDTVYSISVGDVLISDYFSGDTVVYSQLISGQANSLRFNINDLKIDTTVTINPKPWDTVSLYFRY